MLNTENDLKISKILKESKLKEIVYDDLVSGKVYKLLCRYYLRWDSIKKEWIQAYNQYSTKVLVLDGKEGIGIFVKTKLEAKKIWSSFNANNLESVDKILEHLLTDLNIDPKNIIKTIYTTDLMEEISYYDLFIKSQPDKG